MQFAKHNITLNQRLSQIVLVKLHFYHDPIDCGSNSAITCLTRVTEISEVFGGVLLRHSVNVFNRYG
jgi:hypothetical protein